MNKLAILLQYKKDIIAGIQNDHPHFLPVQKKYLIAQVKELFEFLKDEMLVFTKKP